jgi:hypothetical protein
MFTLVTGAPGASKTSNVIAKYAKETSRPVFYRGIRDLTLPWQELTDEETKRWPDHLPDGALLIVDEAQQLWPRRSASQPVPIGLSALETHRHRGWDIVFITQDPGLLDVHARKIANEHFHYVRPFGAPFVTEYHCGTGSINPATRNDLKRCTEKKKPLPKSVWGLYKSAEVHTHKFRPPKILFVVLACAVLAPLAWYTFFSKFGSGGLAQDGKPVIEQSSSSASLVAPQEKSDEPKKSWKELLKPEVAGLPFTAPLYDDIARTPTAVPRLAGCVISRKTMSRCTCYTQQGTTIPDVSRDMCVAFIRGGMFNHLAKDEGERAGDGEARTTPPAPEGGPASGPSVVVIEKQSTPRLSASL